MGCAANTIDLSGNRVKCVDEYYRILCVGVCGMRCSGIYRVVRCVCARWLQQVLAWHTSKHGTQHHTHTHAHDCIRT